MIAGGTKFELLTIDDGRKTVDIGSYAVVTSCHHPLHEIQDFLRSFSSVARPGFGPEDKERYSEEENEKTVACNYSATLFGTYHTLMTVLYDLTLGLASIFSPVMYNCSM